MQDHGTNLSAHLDTLLAETPDDARERERTAFDREIDPFGRSIVLFGAGNMGRRILARLREDGVEPHALADNNPASWGKTIDGLPVLRPEDAATRFGRSAAFIVTIYNRWHNFPDTRAQLQALGCAKVLSVLSFRWKHHDSFLPHYRDDLPHKVLAHAVAIRRAFDLWSDEPSRREFVAQVRFRLDGRLEGLTGPVSGEQYFLDDRVPPMDHEYFVDAGAYDGDTLRTFLRLRGSSFAEYLALEPDPGTFAKLKSLAESLPDEIRRKIRVLPYAVGAQPGRVRFAAEAHDGSAISETGNVEVDLVTLDGLLPDLVATFVKMDIEGAEPDALKGARQLITEGKTAFAVCVYHAQDHLWSIPLLINDMNPGFRYYLRPHMAEGWELVTYAVPSGR
jgi:FkbM family methyltransferase